MLKIIHFSIKICLLFLFLTGVSHAQTSLGLGAGDPTGTAGTTTGILGQINQYQQEFYKSLSSALKNMREDPSNLWLLVGLSFAYGIFHAAGPGHGKAIISSYMIANEVQLKRGITLSFLAAFMQGIMAVIVIGAVYFLLRGSGISMGEATRTLELASYVLIIAFGLFLLWRKLKHFFKPKTQHSGSHHGHDHHHEDHSHHNNDHNYDRHDHEHHHHHEDGHAHHHHHEDGVCSECGHAHMPEPKSIGGDMSIKQAWSAVIAVGIRPCSGSLFVLSFALLNGLYLGGILSVFAISVGTAITVSILAAIAVSAKNLALKYSSSTSSASQISNGIEIVGASLILVLGLLLLSAALA